MKKYLICKDIVNDEDYYDTTAYVQTDEEAEKGDLVVYMAGDTPMLAKIEKFMDELEAITSDRFFAESLKVVSMRDYLKKRAKEVQRAKLIKKMKEEIELNKLEETLKKNSECSPEMADLFAKYKQLNEQ